jgi:poly(3-hydroxybutyrate) depolymerase
MQRLAAIFLAFFLIFEACSASAAPAEPFSSYTLTEARLGRVLVWGPPPGTTGRFDTIVLLHGNQVHAPDPNWMIGLRFVPGFERRILIVPSLPDGQYDWSRADVVHALQRLLTEVSQKWPLDPQRMFLVGYSAAGSRVFAAARALAGEWAGIVSVAGDVMRSSETRFRARSLLFVCMNDDDGQHTSCRLNEANRRALSKRGRDASLERVAGDHALDWARLGPVLERWIKVGR